MRPTLLFLAALLLATSVGCGGSGEIEAEPDSAQAQVFEKLKDIEAIVSLDGEGKIVAVEFENASQGDDALAMLKDIPTLKRVNLSGSGVTDAGMAHLAGIKTLEYVGLEDTRVSPPAARKLGEALPNCRIAYGTGG